MNLSDYVMTFDRALPAQTCEQLIHDFESETGQLSVRNQQGGDAKMVRSFHELNIMQTPVISRAIRAEIVNITYRYAQEYLSATPIRGHHWPAAEHTGLEQYRLKKYNPNGDRFSDHVDVLDYQSARRFLAFFWYLNTPAGGGETEFYNLDKPIKITPEAGRLVMFPPLWTFPHAGLPTTYNPKYILSGYFHYL